MYGESVDVNPEDVEEVESNLTTQSTKQTLGATQAKY